MADYTITAANVKLTTGRAEPAVIGEAIADGQLIRRNTTTGLWMKATDDGASGNFAIALGSGATGQTIAIAATPGDVVAVGAGVIDDGEIVVASAATAGALAPHADLDVPGGDTLFIVGYGNASGEIVLLLMHTGVAGTP